jgi:hypothetical protein
MIIKSITLLTLVSSNIQKSSHVHYFRFQKSRFHLENLPELLKSITDPDIIKQHYGAIGIRRIMSLVD